MITGGIAGVQLAAGDGNSVVVSSTGAASTPIVGSFSYSVNFLPARHIVTGLAPSTGYTVGLSASSGVETVSISPGGTTMTSAQGVLNLSVNSSGAL